MEEFKKRKKKKKEEEEGEREGGMRRRRRRRRGRRKRRNRTRRMRRWEEEGERRRRMGPAKLILPDQHPMWAVTTMDWIPLRCRDTWWCLRRFLCEKVFFCFQTDLSGIDWLIDWRYFTSPVHHERWSQGSQWEVTRGLYWVKKTQLQLDHFHLYRVFWENHIVA